MGVKGHSWAEKLAKRQKTQMEKALLDELKTAREEREQVSNLSVRLCSIFFV